MAAKVKEGLLANIRSDCLKSWKRVPTGWLRDDAIEFDTRVYVALDALALALSFFSESGHALDEKSGSRQVWRPPGGVVLAGTARTKIISELPTSM
jgi:hypothetical protein